MHLEVLPCYRRRVGRDEIENGMTVSAVSILLGVPVPTIRSWERRYGFPRPGRTHGAHRRYSYRDIDQLRAVRDEIASGASASEAVAVVRDRIAGDGEGDAVRAIVEAGLNFDTATIRARLEGAVLERGLDGAIENVALPVLREIGTRWQAGSCDVSQEHVSSQEIRAWLTSRLGAGSPVHDAPVVVLTCGPQDLHTIGLEAFYVMLTRRGLSCRLLGAQTPVPSLITALSSTKATGVVLTSHLSINRRAAVAALRAATELGTWVFYAGNAFGSAKGRTGVPGRYLGRNLAKAADIVHRSVVGAGPGASARG